MTDYTELKLQAEHATGLTDMSLAPEVILALISENERLQSAARTLNHLSYTDNGGELWKPPLGEKPNFGLIDHLKANFKNFHRSLCERFGYYHDEIDWQRDQVSLEEHIATQFSHVNAENAALRGQVEALQRGAGQLQEQNEALRKAADRYEWLRAETNSGPNIQVSEWIGPHEYQLFGDDLDRAIDDALGKAVHP